MTSDMTTGKPAKLILQFMIPVFLGNIFQQFYNLADAVIAGRYLGVNALAAVGSTSPLVFLVIGWMNGITSGFAIMIAQSFGARKIDRMRHYLAMSLYLCTGFVIVLTIALIFLNYPILRMMQAPEALIDDIAGYMHVIYTGLVVTAAYNGLAAVLRALGDSRSPLYFLIISAIINVVLDVVFIVYGNTGVVGCAYATVISQGISALLCLIYMVRKFDILKLHKKDFRVVWYSIVRLLGLGVPMGLQFSITAISIIVVQGAVNSLGPTYIAAFAAAGKIQNIVTAVFVAFGATIATYAGQNRGAQRMDRVHEGVKVTQIMIIIWGVVIWILMIVFGETLTKIFVSGAEKEVLSASARYFQTVAWCYPFLGSIFLYRNVLQGIGYGLVPMMGGIFELIARAAVVAALAKSMGYLGVCLTDPAAWIAALIPIVPYYFYIMKKTGSVYSKT